MLVGGISSSLGCQRSRTSKVINTKPNANRSAVNDRDPVKSTPDLLLSGKHRRMPYEPAQLARLKLAASSMKNRKAVVLAGTKTPKIAIRLWHEAWPLGPCDLRPLSYRCVF